MGLFFLEFFQIKSSQSLTDLAYAICWFVRFMATIGLMSEMTRRVYLVFFVQKIDISQCLFSVLHIAQMWHSKLPQSEVFPLLLGVVSNNKTKSMLQKLAHLSVIPLY